MLPDLVLSELARRGPLQRMLVTAAWPSLTTESRLQVISVVQRQGVTRSTPDWLLDLAQTDPSEVVRYWAARAYRFEETVLEFSPAEGSGVWPYLSKPASSEELARAAWARADSSELVRLSVEDLGMFADGKLNEMSHLQRLVSIRNASHLSFCSFMEWLANSVEASFPDQELCECAEEFFSRPDVAEDLRQVEFSDGMTEYREGKAIELGWELLTGKVGRLLGSYLVMVLPVKRGLTIIEAEKLASLPEDFLSAAIWRRNEDPVFADLANMVRDQPERFPPSVVKSLAIDDEEPIAQTGDGARTDYLLRNAVDRTGAAMEVLLSIRKDLQRLHARLDELQQGAVRRRGIFG